MAKKTYGVEIGKCPSCNEPVGDKQPDPWCYGCGNRLPEDIQALIPALARYLSGSQNVGSDGPTSASVPTVDSILSSRVEVSAGSESLARIQKNVMTRYWNAYVVARTTVGIGVSVKLAAYLVATSIVLLGFVASSETRTSSLAIGGILAAAIFGIPIYVLGVQVSAQGETLKASLDTAVNSSTFLDDDQRAKVMSLR